ncbi:alpha/beta hydrolase [Sphingobacterium daejeonense]|uniref:alpha/beta hydrolase n=1 Tax=Sphingobacterium daejeonense TaxID=371142 RepID=UPI0010C258A2|nr:alpha/beta hydrolase [Sphingobacterium daejeonense]VTP97370.1 Acetyl esterase [Sphingobacterium daejeonense]
MQTINITENIIFDSNHNLKLDIYEPSQNPKGALIDIHGGGWFRGDKSKENDLASVLAENGFLVFVPNYRIAPEFLYPAPVEDMETILSWVKSSDYKFDKNNIGFIGSSAGGNLAIEMGLKTGLPIASWSGMIDIENWIQNHQDVVPSKGEAQDGGIQSGPNDALYKWAILNYTGEDQDLIKKASLLERVTKKAGPMFLANSLNEFCPVDPVFQLAQNLADLKIASVTQIIPGTKHAKGYLNHAIDYTLIFFEDCFKKNK